MAFVLTAKLNLLPPSNVAIIAGQIRKQLNNVNEIPLNLVAPTNIKQVVNSINSSLRGVNKNININLNSKTLSNSAANIQKITVATNTLSKSAENLGFQAAKSFKHYAAFALTTSSVIKLTAAFGSGIGDAIKYDRELIRISQVTGQSLEGLKNLSKEVTKLSTSFGVSSESILESAVTLSQAGLSANDTRIALEALAKTSLSATFGDIKGTGEAAIAIMQQFGYEAKDMEGILSSVNAVSAAFAIESDDIAVAVRRSGGALRAAGVNFHEFGALLTSVRQTTRESAESIATGFRTIFARLQRSRTQDFLKNLGIDVLNDKGLFVGGYEAIRRIHKALEDISTVDPRFSQIVEELGGFRQVSKVIPLLEKFPVAQKALNVSLRGGNSLTLDAVKAQESLEVQLTKTREQFLALIRDIVTETSFKVMIKGVLSLANAFISVADSIKHLLPYIGLLAAINYIPNLKGFKTGVIKGLAGGVKGYATGGTIPGVGSGDTVPALLTPGEFVIKKTSAKRIGYDTLNRMNRSGHAIQRFSTGGGVQAGPPVYPIFRNDPHAPPKSFKPEINANAGIGIALFALSEVIDKAFGNSSPISKLTKASLGLFGAFTVYTAIFKKTAGTVSNSKRLYKYSDLKKQNDKITSDSVIKTDKAFVDRIANKRTDIKNLADSNIKNMINNEASTIESQERLTGIGRADKNSKQATSRFANKINPNHAAYNKVTADNFITKANKEGFQFNIGQETIALREAEINKRTDKAVRAKVNRAAKSGKTIDVVQETAKSRAKISSNIASENNIFSHSDLISNFKEDNYQKGIVKSEDKIKNETRVRRKTAANTIRNSSDFTGVIGSMNDGLNQIIPNMQGDIDQRVKNLRRKNLLLDKKRLERTSLGAAGLAAAGMFGGNYLKNKGEAGLYDSNTENDSISRNMYAGGEALSVGATAGAAGLQFGAAFGPQGAVIGLALGSIGGAIYGFANAAAEADKILRSVKLDKDLENLGNKFKSLNNETSSINDIKGSVSGIINEQFKSISNTTGTEKSDAIAKFKGSASEIENFYNQVAKNSSSLEDFNKATNNSLIKFSAISGIDFVELISSVNNTIKAEKRAKEAIDKMSSAAVVTSNNQIVLDSFITALALASNSLDSFDRNLERIDANTNFTGASYRASGAGDIFKSAAGGRFSDSDKIATVSSNLLSQFGSVGNRVAKQTGESALARQLIPGIIKEFVSSPLSGEKSPTDLARKRLGEAGISSDVLNQVLAGITNAIGDESNSGTLRKKFAADPNGTFNEITKTLTPTIESMQEFANKVSEHNTKIGRLFEASSNIQAKINDMKLEEASKITDLTIRLGEESGKTLSIDAAKGLDARKIGLIGGRNGTVEDFKQMASDAQDEIEKLDKVINDRDVAGLKTEDEQKARQENIDTLKKASAALEEMSKNGYAFAAIEKALTKAGEERRFRKDSLLNQAFGSKESKLTEAKNMAAIMSLNAGTSNINQYNDDAKAKILSYAETNKDVTLPGLDNISFSDVIKKIVIQDQASKLQQSGLSPEAALAKAKDNVKQGFDSTNTEDTLRKQLLDAALAQGAASSALQQLLERKDPLNTGLLQEVNNNFIGELKNVLIESLINKEKVNFDNAQEVLNKANQAEELPPIEKIKRAIEIRSALDTKDRNLERFQDAEKSSLTTIDEAKVKIKQTGSKSLGDTDNARILKELKDSLQLSEADYNEVIKKTSRRGNTASGQIMVRGNVDAIMEGIIQKYRENQQSKLRSENSLNDEAFKDLRTLPENLRNKNSTELQDILEMKQSAPTQSQIRGATLQKEASEQSIRNLQNDTVTRMDNSVNGLNQFATNFNNSLDKINGMSMTLEGNHKVEVIFNGAEMFKELMPSIEEMVTSRTKDAINKYSELNFPSAQKV